MTQASVGFQCPECVAAGRAGQRQPRRAPSMGRTLTTVGSQSVVVVLIGLIVLSQVVDAVTGGLASSLLAYHGEAIRQGQVWRLVTYMVVPGGFFPMLINGFVLWIIGRSMESMWGKARFLATFLLSGLGAATLMLLLVPVSVGITGSSISIIGLLAANAAFKLRAKEDIRSDLVLLAILVAFSVFTFPPFVVADVGAIAAGGATGWVWAGRGSGQVQRRGRLTASDQVHLRGVAIILAACVALLVAAFLLP